MAKPNTISSSSTASLPSYAGFLDFIEQGAHSEEAQKCWVSQQQKNYEQSTYRDYPWAKILAVLENPQPTSSPSIVAQENPSWVGELREGLYDLTGIHIPSFQSIRRDEAQQIAALKKQRGDESPVTDREINAFEMAAAAGVGILSCGGSSVSQSPDAGTVPPPVDAGVIRCPPGNMYTPGTIIAASNTTGLCKNNVIICDETGHWQPSPNNYQPVVAKLCDGLDHNCDGKIDEGAPVIPSSNTKGLCKDNVDICVNGHYQPDPSNYKPVAPSPACNGADTNCVGEVDPNGVCDVAAVEAGFMGACVLLKSGAIQCWAAALDYRDLPPKAFAQISMGESTVTGSGFVCGLFSAEETFYIPGSVQCWSKGQGTDNDPDFFDGSEIFTQISAGTDVVCGVLTSGGIKCIGNTAFLAGFANFPPTGTFTQVSVGDTFACGLQKITEAVQCWGDNHYGETNAPAGTFTQVSAGNDFACSLLTSGAIKCWGDNTYGQSTPPNGTFSQVSAGNDFACGIQKTTGAVQCWGGNGLGQNGTSPPVGIFTEISAGYNFACGLLNTGKIKCWGDNTYRQATPPPYLQ